MSTRLYAAPPGWSVWPRCAESCPPATPHTSTHTLTQAQVVGRWRMVSPPPSRSLRIVAHHRTQSRGARAGRRRKPTGLAAHLDRTKPLEAITPRLSRAAIRRVDVPLRVDRHLVMSAESLEGTEKLQIASSEDIKPAVRDGGADV